MSQIFTDYTADAATKGRQSESKTEWLKPELGENLFRILPPLKGMAEPWVTVHQHFHKTNGKIFVFNCPTRMANQRCPTCEQKTRLEKAGDTASLKKAEECKVSTRNFAFAIDRENPDAGIRVFGFGATIKERFRNFRDKQKKDFTDLKEGFDVLIDKSGEGLNTKYQVDTASQCPVVEEGSMKAFNKWAGELPSLTDFMKVMEFDDIVNKAALVLGVTPPQQANQLAAAAETVEDDIGDVDSDEDDNIPF